MASIIEEYRIQGFFFSHFLNSSHHFPVPTSLQSLVLLALVNIFIVSATSLLLHYFEIISYYLSIFLSSSNFIVMLSLLSNTG